MVEHFHGPLPLVAKAHQLAWGKPAKGGWRRSGQLTICPIAYAVVHQGCYQSPYRIAVGLTGWASAASNSSPSDT